MAKEVIESLMPGLIKGVSVKVGDVVKEGDTLCILEAMKMENPIFATSGGRVSEVNVSDGQSVKRGDRLFVVEG